MNNKWETQGLHNTQFHSSRKERHVMGGPELKKKKGFFQRTPAFRIFIIDLIFIVIISGVIVPFIMKREGTSKIDNYKLSLKAFNYDEEVMAILTVIEIENLPSEGIIDASFYFEDDNMENIESDLLPGNGEERVLKFRMKSENSDYLYCNVQINGKNKTIRKKIQ